MKVDQLRELAVLRAVVGFLGEQTEKRWWSSSFFGTGSQAFLGPIFPRTQILAQYHATSRVAAVLHDERIGIGNVFHIFRLPEDMERSLHDALQQHNQVIAEHVVSPEVAFTYLNKISTTEDYEGVGPVKVGSIDDLRQGASWGQVASYYATGLARCTEVYPYFTDK